ncbi:MAG: hypothetical protein AAF677_01510 [Pseudomonadota bacterium]
MPDRRDGHRAHCRCLGRARGTLPETRAELAAAAALTPLDPDLQMLGMVGTGLEDALISTRSAGALVMGRGGYGPLQLCGTPLRLLRRRVNLRVAAGARVAVARAAGGHPEPARGALVVFDAAGRVAHRIQYQAGPDEALACSLDRADTADPCEPGTGIGTGIGAADEAEDRLGGTPPPAPGCNVIPLQAIRAARARWDDSGLAHHLDDALADGGRLRHGCLAHVGAGRSRRVQAGMLRSFFACLAERMISFARAVPASGLMQFDIGPIRGLSETGSILLAQTDNGAFSLDLDHLGSAWVVRVKGAMALELYSRDRQSLAICHADPSQDPGTWNDIMTCFPAA